MFRRFDVCVCRLVEGCECGALDSRFLQHTYAYMGGGWQGERFLSVCPG